jgi:ATP-dependent 26S proteasome regulatory subunit
MLLAVQPRSMSMIPPSLAKKAKPAEGQQNPQDRLEQAIQDAQPKIRQAVSPVAELIDGKDLTAAENKVAAEKVSAFSEKIRVMGAQVHPFVNYNSMLESWLGASPFRQNSESREIAPLLPGLKYKGVHDVIEQEYKVLHSVAAEGWNKSIVAPKFSRVRTGPDSFESIPTEVIYLCEDKQGRRLVVELRKEWSNEPPRLTVFSHVDQGEMVEEFYSKLNNWVDKNNFYKNQVLQYVEPPMGDPYMDFQDGIKSKPTSWSDIALTPQAEKLIKSNTVDFFKNLEAYKENGKFANRNLLLAGPPGTGKSMVNDILIQELKDDVTFVYVTSKSIHNSGSIAGIFDAARMLGPSVILMEDLDLVGSTDRNNNARKDILNELLNQLSGIYDNTGLVVMGSTNQASAFDEAMLRPLRFSTIVPMPLPDKERREAILKKITANIILAPDVDLASIAERTDKFSGAGMTELKEMAIQAAIEAHSINAEDLAIVRAADFDKALELIRQKKEYMEQLAKDEAKPEAN